MNDGHLWHDGVRRLLEQLNAQLNESEKNSERETNEDAIHLDLSPASGDATSSSGIT
jgi:hypothetical protein